MFRIGVQVIIARLTVIIRLSTLLQTNKVVIGSEYFNICTKSSKQLHAYNSSKNASLVIIIAPT